MPCLNEEQTVGTCVEKAIRFLEENEINGEVLIADNGSSDNSIEFALEKGARVVHVSAKGYGNALRGGFEDARGKFIIMGDADDSYNFLELMPFVEKLREGYDLVMGNRFWGGVEKGAMPWHHRYIGNPILSGIGQLFFKTPSRDFHCGLRGFTKKAISKMNLITTGMELASEIVIKASVMDMKVCEVPTTLSPDGRDRSPHLRSFRDGWRHLRFLLIFSPRWLFFYPGLLLMIIGTIVAAILYFRPINVFDVVLDLNTMLYACILIIGGFNTTLFAILARVYAFISGLLPQEPSFQQLFKYVNLERGLLLSALLLLSGIGLTIRLYLIWRGASYGELDPSLVMRISIPGATLIALGIEMALFSFFFSILGLDVNPTFREFHGK
jgi:glycosyltransferase involved in cell wall biosynthesis